MPSVGAMLRSLGVEGRATMLEMPQSGVSLPGKWWQERAARAGCLGWAWSPRGWPGPSKKGVPVSGSPPRRWRARRLAELADSKTGRGGQDPRHAPARLRHRLPRRSSRTRNERLARRRAHEAEDARQKVQSTLAASRGGGPTPAWRHRPDRPRLTLDRVLHVFTVERERYAPRGPLARGSAPELGMDTPEALLSTLGTRLTPGRTRVRGLIRGL